MSVDCIKKYLFALGLLVVIISISAVSVQAASPVTKYVDVKSGYLNVRSGPGEDYKKVGTLQKYAKVSVYSTTKSGWSEIRYDKKKAYVMSKYLVNVNLKNSRVTYTLKDKRNKSYQVYMIATKEKKAKASYTSTDWDTVWAGANPGDQLYKADYKLYLRKNGSNHISKTNHGMKGYVYNKTRSMVYSIPSKHKGQSDLFVIGETMSSNFEEGKLFYISSGKLKKAESLGYTQRPRIIKKNIYQTASYDNSVGKWYIIDYKFDYINGKLQQQNCKTVNSLNTWKKDWK